MALHAFGRLVLGDQRVSLVGERENQIRLLLAGVLVGVNQGNAVEDVTGIQKKHRDSRGENGSVVCQQTYGQKLGRACVHKQRHGECPGQTVTGFLQQDTEADTQEQISGHYGNRIQENGFQSFFMHVFSPSWEIETAGQDLQFCWKSSRLPGNRESVQWGYKSAIG